MYKLEFTLKQHTPLIHFQHDQAGATLRATEVKPKLDQFLIEKLTGKIGFGARILFHKLIFSESEKWSQRKNWLIGKVTDLKPVYTSQDERNTALSHLAFNYKLSFNCIDNHSGEIQEIMYEPNGIPAFNNEGKIKVRTFPGFFGNNGNETIEDFKWFSWTDLVNAKFIIFDEELKKIIYKYFAGFVFHNNFGTRKTKGFGSLTVLNPDGNSIKAKDSSKYYFDVKLPNFDENNVNQLIRHYGRHDYGDLNKMDALYLLQNKYLFDFIDVIYRAMRSGINIPNRNAIPCTNDSSFYLKSFLFSYFKERFKIQWDKKSIKEHFYFASNCLSEQKSVNTNPDNPVNFADTLPKKDKKLIRDLLGLSTEQSWMSYNKDTIIKESKTKINNESIYSRFTSPIVFKPLKFSDRFRVFIEYCDFPSELNGKAFEVSSKKNAKLYPLVLTFPDSFSIQDYLQFIFEDKDAAGKYIIDLDTYIQSEFQGDDVDQYFILSRVFNSIRHNLKKQ